MADVSTDRRRYCVVIPAFEAARTIGTIVQRVREQGLAVVVIDDGSRDGTAAAASARGAVVISHLRNFGKGRALRTGFAYALRERFDGVVTLDSDGQHDPAEILRLIHAGERQHAGLVIGNRMANGLPMPRARRWTNDLMSRMVSAIARQSVPDSQCGFRVIRRELLQDIALRTERFEIESEVLLAAACRRWKIISVPIQTIYTDHHSHIQPLVDGARFVWLLARFFVSSSRSRQPAGTSPPA